MNTINFTGVKNLRVFTISNPDKPHFPELPEKDRNVNVIRLECELTDDDFDYFKEITDKSRNFVITNTKISPQEPVCIDVRARENKNQYDLFLNKTEIVQNERPIFAIVTFLCALTKAIKDVKKDNIKLHKFLDMINLACDRVGRKALKNVP